MRGLGANLYFDISPCGRLLAKMPSRMEFDLIYVNGDNNLENLRREDETLKVRLIEEDFKRFMFDVKDV